MATFRYDKETIIGLVEKRLAKCQEDRAKAAESYRGELRTLADDFKQRVEDWWLNFDPDYYVNNIDKYVSAPQLQTQWPSKIRGLDGQINYAKRLLERLQLVKADTKDSVRLSDKDELWRWISEVQSDSN